MINSEVYKAIKTIEDNYAQVEAVDIMMTNMRARLEDYAIENEAMKRDIKTINDFKDMPELSQRVINNVCNWWMKRMNKNA